MVNELSPDQKGQASLTLGEVIQTTRQNFPDSRYHPNIYLDTPQYHIYGIDPSPYQIWVTADGIGTKPELAERWSMINSLGGTPNYRCFGNLAFDTFAMIDGDEARFGRQLLGIANILDMNEVDPQAIFWLAVGAKNACDTGRFALLNGETAELGYRSSGYGKIRVNWNAVGVSLIVPDKLILGQELEAGQPLVVFREKSIRSNGLTRARAILEAAFIHKRGYQSKENFFLRHLYHHVNEVLNTDEENPLNKEATRGLADSVASPDFLRFLDQTMGHPFLEQVLLPWHELDERILDDLLEPSTLYGKVINEAQGWVGGKKQVNITAAAHITGGGIPEKVKRMVEPQKLGAYLEPVFPDPKAIKRLFEIADTLPKWARNKLINDRIACQQWNRGIGFVVATKTKGDANKLVQIAEELGYEAAVAGRITDKPQIKFRGHTWAY